MRIHDLRHSHAHLARRRRRPAELLQRVVGHERSSTTLDLYTRRTDDASRILRALDDSDPSDGPGGTVVPA